MTATAPKFRLSTIRDCPRRAVLEQTVEPDRELYDSEQRIMFRGRELGQSYARMLHAASPGAEILTEVEIPWPSGLGHADVLVTETRSLIEVLSSAHASEEMIRSKLRQVVLYREYGGEKCSGPPVLVILNPSDFSEERIILDPDSTAYAELKAEAMAKIDEVETWVFAKELPARVCRKPADARSHFCRFSDTCFTGWEPPDVEHNEEAREAFVALYMARTAERMAAAELKHLTDSRKEAEQSVDAYFQGPGKLMSGPIQVTRLDKTRVSFDVKKARLEGVPDELLDRYSKVSQWTELRVDRVTDEALVTADSFGDEAPF